MDDLRYGKRNKRGDWAPTHPVQYAPLFQFPTRIMAILKWLPHYFFPWNVIFAASAVAYWAWIIPSVETMRTLGFGWIGWLYAVNAVCVFLFYGAFELHLYVLKRDWIDFAILDPQKQYNDPLHVSRRTSRPWHGVACQQAFTGAVGALWR